MSGYFWRLPQKPRKERAETPAPPAPPLLRPPSSRPPSARATPPAPVAFTLREIQGRSVLVSAQALRFLPAELAEALRAHGPLGGSRESKHRLRGGTLMVVSNSAEGETLIATTSELRLMRRGLGTSARSDQRRRRGK